MRHIDSYCTLNQDSKHRFPTFQLNRASTLIMFVVLADVVIVERLKNLKKVENDSVKMQCKVKNPRNYPIEWFKDGLPMTVSDVR